jgi:hypothetical protein
MKKNGSLNHDEKIKAELTKCNSLNEMFKVLDKYYDLDKKISPMLKPTAVYQITKNIKTITTALSIKER